MGADSIRNAIIEVFKSSANVTNSFRIQLQGTLTFTNGSAAVTGVGTAFRTNPEQAGDIKKGDYIRATTSTKWYKVLSVASPTALTLSEVFAEATETGVVGYVLHLALGLVRNTDFVSELRGIKLYLMTDVADIANLGYSSQHVSYKFQVSAFFFEPDDSEIETRKVTYANLLRKAIEADIKLGVSGKLVASNVAYKADIGATSYHVHPAVEGPAYLTFVITAINKETVG